jgi:hypothetical protein
MKIQRIPNLVVFLILLTFSITVTMPKVEHSAHINLIEYISTKYKKDPKLIELIVLEAEKHSNKDSFPTIHDTLAIISIESAFKPTAVSKSKAKGLMQVLYTKTSFNIKENISKGIWLLKDYRSRLVDIDSVVQSYNLGIGNFKNGMRNQDYLNKFKQAKEELKNEDIL